MNRLIMFSAAVAIAAVPAGFGLAGSSSFAQGVSVRTPLEAATPISESAFAEDRGLDSGMIDDSRAPGDELQPADDRGLDAGGADDKGGQSSVVEPGDDKGGQSSVVEPGDDKGGHNVAVSPSSPATIDDKGGQSSGGHGGNDGSGHQ